jgi:TonB family protein
MNTGSQTPSSVATSCTVNVVLAIIICIIGLAARKVHQQHVLLTSLTEPVVKKVEPKKEEPKPKPPPKIVEPKVVIQQPKLEMPKIQKVVKLDVPKPPTPVVHMATPLPNLATQQVKVIAPPTPKSLAMGGPAVSPAKVIQSDPNHISSLNQAIKAGQQDRTARSILFSNAGVAGGTAITRQAASLGGLGNGGGGSAGNGAGSRHTTSLGGLGNGGAGGGGTGSGTGRTTTAVAIAPMIVQAAAAPRQMVTGVVKPLKITSKLTPSCTADAKQSHIEGQVFLNVNFGANGSVAVLGVARGLGHGLDESAKAAAQQMRFEPETVDGRPVDKKEVIAATFACSPQ